MGGDTDAPVFVSVEIEPCEDGLGEDSPYHVATVGVEPFWCAEQLHATEQYLTPGAESCLYVCHLPPDAFLFPAYFLHLGTEFFLWPVRVADVGHDRGFFGVELREPFGEFAAELVIGVQFVSERVFSQSAYFGAEVSIQFDVLVVPRDGRVDADPFVYGQVGQVAAAVTAADAEEVIVGAAVAVGFGVQQPFAASSAPDQTL